MFRHIVASTALTVLMFFGSGAVSHAADMLRLYEDNQDCADDRVLKGVSRQIDYQSRRVPGVPQVDIVDYYAIHQNDFLPEAYKRPIARRYCQASAALSNGETRTVWYLIEYGQGFAGALGDNVEACMQGFDEWNVYDEACRVVRSGVGRN
ncbi:hypothetical protein B7H23_14065 [Notoacmeibacter marinus]|uniref:Uncharacterized protein n=1 Tax=Notoacmeibacter marinus TaxID=1876515 RepID=A0A231UTS6_9HYPH|nr:hypothetical protein [Notoacmeibacter marinus]OXS99296.1 hypothetical protein B7H23_14065 [Notoacmeibacter marinus]